MCLFDRRYIEHDVFVCSRVDRYRGNVYPPPVPVNIALQYAGIASLLPSPPHQPPPLTNRHGNLQFFIDKLQRSARVRVYISDDEITFHL